MSLVDANILLYAENSLSSHHDVCRVWWDRQLSGSDPVALCWPVITAFIRIGTNPRLHQRPLALKEAVERVQSWLDQPGCSNSHPFRPPLEDLSAPAPLRQRDGQSGFRRATRRTGGRTQ